MTPSNDAFVSGDRMQEGSLIPMISKEEDESGKKPQTNKVFAEDAAFDKPIDNHYPKKDKKFKFNLFNNLRKRIGAPLRKVMPRSDDEADAHEWELQ